MKKIGLLITLLCIIVLSGCRKQPDASGVPDISQQPEISGLPSPTPWEEKPSQKEEGLEEEVPEQKEDMEEEDKGSLAVSDKDEIKMELAEAMRQLRQPRVMEVSSLVLEYPEIDVKNIYYSIVRDYPELKYAYNLEVTVDGTELKCQIYYMPYKMGVFPDDFVGEEVGSLQDLLAVAESYLGELSFPIRITNTQMDPDDMSRALQQVGGGYIFCSLNVDATAIQYSAPSEMTMEDCITALDLAGSIADEVISQVVTPGMTQYEQAKAVYSYLAQEVSYDQRYYSDRSNMPYESQTALGALRDHLAICGGYANALKILYEKIGIPCYNVTGKYFSENHMWNLAKLDGEWLWFDATSDRGNSPEYGFLRFALKELDETKYQYKEKDIRQLIED